MARVQAGDPRHQPRGHRPRHRRRGRRSARQVPAEGAGRLSRRSRSVDAAFAALLVSSVLISAGCAGTHPAPRVAWDSKADLAAPKTFAWDHRRDLRLPHGDSIVDGEFLDRRIRAAVDRELAARGYTAAGGGAADLLVSYRTGQDGVASQDEWGVYDWWAFPIYVYEGSDYEKERVLTLELRDPGHKLLWRGQVQRLEGSNPEAVGREIDRQVAELFARLPGKK